MYKDLFAIKSYSEEEREELLTKVLLRELRQVKLEYIVEVEKMNDPMFNQAAVSINLKHIDQRRAIIFDELVCLGYMERAENESRVKSILNDGQIEEE